MKTTAGIKLLAGVALTTFFSVAHAADFYAGKTITMVVGASSSGSYARYSNVLAKHMGKHIPGNPTIKVDFRGGGSGGLTAANFLDNAVPKDGLFFGITQQTIPLNQVLDPEKGNYDAGSWQWIGGISPVRNMLSLWHTAPAQTIEEAKKTEVKVGATGTSSPMFLVPHMMNEFLGTKFKIILGYDGISGTNLAMEQGEVQGRGASWLSVVQRTPQYIEKKLLKPIVVDAATRDPMIPNVPTLTEVAPDEATKQVFQLLSSASVIGRSYFFPNGVPGERVAIVRKAFMETMKDPDFLAAAKKGRVTVEPVSHEELAEAVAGLKKMPSNVVNRAKAALAKK